MEQSKQYQDAAQRQSIPKTTPGDFLPDAYILAIAKKAAEGVELPPPATIAQAILEHPQLLKDYALVLTEAQRGEFLAAFPEEKRAQLSGQLDQTVSEVLNVKHIASTEEVEQHEAVKGRVQEAFLQALQGLKSPLPPTEGIPTKAVHESHLMGRQITETLVNLGDEESLQILRSVSQQTTRTLKDLNKDLKKMTPVERSRALRPVMSFTARVLNTLIEVDTRRGGVLAMRYLEMTALPEHMFTFFARKLTDREYFTKNLPAFLANPENIPVLKRLMAQYGPQFNTIIDTVTQIPDYAVDHNLSPHQQDLFEALTDLDTLTPRIYERYRHLPSEERKTFAEKIKLLKPQFFRNMPIKGILAASDRDILTEMVYMAYKPMGMTFEHVDRLIGRIDDHTDDISGFVFPQEGYPLTLERQRVNIAKEQQKVDITSIRRIRNLLLPVVTSDEAQEPISFAKAWSLALEPVSQPQEATGPQRDKDAVLRTLLLPFQAQPRVQEFLQRYPEIRLENAYQVEGELAEIMGIYFQDNYSRLVGEYLTTHTAQLQEITTLLSSPDIRTILNDRLQEGIPINWDEFDKVMQSSPPKYGLLSRMFSRPSTQPQELIAQILTRALGQEHIEPVRKTLKSELAKFALGSEGGKQYQGLLKAYISKNVGSFFAKAAAGICTAEDIPLFEREDHFHINVVENDETVRANVQAYIAKVNGKQALVLRGFNPTADWLGKIDVGSFAEQILSIGRQFQQDNGLDAVYITEQGDWHALSNREQVARYLTSIYIDGKPKVPFSLKVASSESIKTVYPIS